MLLLLDLELGAVLEGPLDDVGVVGGALDKLGLGQGGPEVGEVLQPDVVPDVGERRLDDGALHHRSGGWDWRGLGGGRRHVVVMVLGCVECLDVCINQLLS